MSALASEATECARNDVPLERRSKRYAVRDDAAAFPTKVCTYFGWRVFKSGFTQGNFEAHASFLHHPRRERCPQRSAAPMDGSRNGPKEDEIENSPKSKLPLLHKGMPARVCEAGGSRLTAGTFFFRCGSLFGTPGAAFPTRIIQTFAPYLFGFPLRAIPLLGKMSAKRTKGSRLRCRSCRRKATDEVGNPVPRIQQA